MASGRRRGALTSRLPPTSEPDLAPELQAAIIQALRDAWAALRVEQSKLLSTGEEEAITHALQRALNDNDDTGERRIAALSLFGIVNREASVTANDGGYKRCPDLIFRPVHIPRGVRNGSDWGFWVEAKIINGESHPVRLYVSEGVERFCSGQYAARVGSSALVAYVRDGQRVRTALKERVSLIAGSSTDFAHSRHARDTAKPPMVRIELSHLWLAV